MRKKILKLLFWFAGFIVIIVILNVKVTTKQGIDFKVHTLKIPLYLKTMDFFDRHYNYKWLVQRIIGDSKTDKEKVFKIFQWTHENIKKMPKGYPVIDDHAWHIIVRGYGLDDQSADVFTTLCNYAGADAFFNWVEGEGNDVAIALSFVKIKGRWIVFDSYNGVYFKNKENNLADIAEIAKGDWLIESIDNSGKPNIDYAHYLKNIQPIKRVGLIRSNTQSPFNRLRYEIKKCLRQLL
jgi:hypothetical protein